MSVHYHPGKANVVVDTLSRRSMGSLSHVPDVKKELRIDVHRLSWLVFGLKIFQKEDSRIIITPSHF